MSNYNTSKKGHPVLGIVLGILGIVIALLLTLIGGMIAGVIAGVLGLVAVLLGISAHSGKGVASIVIGALAIILAVVMTVSTVALFTKLKEEAEQYSDDAPLVVSCLRNPNLALVGMIINLPKDEGSAQELINQFNMIKDKIGITSQAEDTPAATEAPAEEPAG